MKIKIFIERINKTKKIEANNIKEIFQKLCINPQEVIITRNNELITEDEKLNNNDEIKLLSVISGG